MFTLRSKGLGDQHAMQVGGPLLLSLKKGAKILMFLHIFQTFL